MVLARAITYSFSKKPKIKETKGFLFNIKVTFYSEVVTLSLDGIYADSGRIGGPGHIIEVDEMKIGRRRFERGRVVEGAVGS